MIITTILNYNNKQTNKILKKIKKFLKKVLTNGVNWCIIKV